MNTATAATRHDAELQSLAREEAFSMPIDEIDVSKPRLFQEDTIGHYFERLRRDDPVHFTENQFYGRFWSVTKYKDIMAVDTNHGVYSSDCTQGGIALWNAPDVKQRLQMFIAMDPPKHDEQRKAVSPIVAPANLASMESTIRARTAKVLDELPRNEEFNWVQRVSIELTTLMLATLFDFPFEDRRLLTWWSDVATSVPEVDHVVESQEARMAELGKMLAYFTRLWNERVNAPPKNDLVSMLAHNPATRHMTPHGVHGQPGAADRRRQRHHAQLDERRAAGDEPLSRRMGQAARQPRAGGQHGVGDHPLADAAAEDARAPRCATSSSAARRSARATRW